MKHLGLMMLLISLSACTVYYQPGPDGRHEDERRGRGGVVIDIPQKKPEVRPMPN